MPWYVQVKDELFGPYDDTQLKSLATAGRIDPETQIAQSREGPWVTASRVKGLFVGLTQAQAVAVAPNSSHSSDVNAAELLGIHAQTVEQLEAISTTLSRIVTRVEIASNNAAGSQNSGMQYKVLTQKDKWFSGKFDPEKLEGAINSYAAQGWRVRGVATATFPGFGGSREEMVVVMEREA
jgi:hypothetical protein